MRRAALPIATSLVVSFLTIGAGMAAPFGQPRYVGTFTGEPERDSYGYAEQTIPTEHLCITGPKRYVGTVTGDPEKDSFGYPTKLVHGTSCPVAVASKG